LTALRQRRDLDGSSSIYSSSWSFTPLRNLFVNLNLIQSRAAGGSDRQALLILSYNFGNNVFASAQLLHDQNGGSQAQLTAQKGLADVLGFGYMASTGLGPNARHSAQALWSQERGSLSGEVDQFAGQRGYRAAYSTGLAWQEPSVFWTRPISGNFTVVDTRGVADVPVFADEHLVGRTDESGILLVPNMRPYEVNRLRIDDSDLSMRYQIDSAEHSVRLPLRGSSRVVFAVRQDLSLVLRLRQTSGDFVPAGAYVELADGSEGLPVGFDGKVYVEDAARHLGLTARWPGHRCEAHWPRPASAGRTINVVCKEVSQ
jgi:outer membrane usher protein